MGRLRSGYGLIIVKATFTWTFPSLLVSALSVKLPVGLARVATKFAVDPLSLEPEF